MAVTFCGHGDINYGKDIKDKIYNLSENLIKSGQNEFLFGGYGNFDITAAHTLKELKKKYPHIKLILIIPYLNRKYNMDLYDYSIYPPIENVPKKIAIIKRNEYMIKKSDIVIAYVTRNFGGAAKTLDYAVKNNKCVKNISK